MYNFSHKMNKNKNVNYWVAIGNLGIFFTLILVMFWTSDLERKSKKKLMKVTGLVLARCGSKGIKKKNLAEFNGTSLLQTALQTMQNFGKFDNIWVSTDCQEVVDHVNKFLPSVKVHHRGPYTATDTASSLSAVQEFCEQHSEVEAVGLIQCTSPFIQTAWLDDAFKMLILQNYDSVFSVVRKHNLLWEPHEDGIVKPFNFDPSKRPRRQDWNGFLVENGMFYFTRVEIIKQNLLQGGRIGVVEIPANYSLEIDSEFDLKVARSIFKILQNQ
ncbi:CMP-sialic acid synthase [Lycorma delicatula]|uniref:CMP-sialic acid synthase n=1 Tax=Lycorma delicatula TaxID=130591 RepID=UPI003F51162B